MKTNPGRIMLCTIYILSWQKRLQFICNVDQTYNCVEIGSGFSFSLPFSPAPTYPLSQIPLGNFPSYTSYWWYNKKRDICGENAGDQVQLPFLAIRILPKVLDKFTKYNTEMERLHNFSSISLLQKYFCSSISAGVFLEKEGVTFE